MNNKMISLEELYDSQSRDRLSANTDGLDVRWLGAIAELYDNQSRGRLLANGDGLNIRRLGAIQEPQEDIRRKSLLYGNRSIIQRLMHFFCQ